MIPRTILITGCSKCTGIGMVAARRLRADGHAVHTTVRVPQEVGPAAAGLGPGIPVHVLDLDDETTIVSAVREVETASGGIDVLVNNAGTGLLGTVESLERDLLASYLATNVGGTVRVTQEVLPGMRERGRGHVITMATVFTARHAPPGVGGYIAAKAALQTIMQALAVEVAAWGIRVTDFQPGPARTVLTFEQGGRFAEGEDPTAGLVEAAYGWFDQAAPDWQQPEEVAAALAELVALEPPPFRRQSSPSATAYVAQGLTDPTGERDRDALVDFILGAWTPPVERR